MGLHVPPSSWGAYFPLCSRTARFAGSVNSATNSRNKRGGRNSSPVGAASSVSGDDDDDNDPPGLADASADDAVAVAEAAGAGTAAASSAPPAADYGFIDSIHGAKDSRRPGQRKRSRPWFESPPRPGQGFGGATIFGEPCTARRDNSGRDGCSQPTSGCDGGDDLAALPIRGGVGGGSRDIARPRTEDAEDNPACGNDELRDEFNQPMSGGGIVYGPAGDGRTGRKPMGDRGADYGSMRGGKADHGPMSNGRGPHGPMRGSGADHGPMSSNWADRGPISDGKDDHGPMSDDRAEHRSLNGGTYNDAPMSVDSGGGGRRPMTFDEANAKDRPTREGGWRDRSTADCESVVAPAAGGRASDDMLSLSGGVGDGYGPSRGAEGQQLQVHHHQQEQEHAQERTVRVVVNELLSEDFGLFTWPSGVVLACLVWARRREFRGLSVVEIGAGTALPGLLAAKLGASVVLTDREDAPWVLDNMREAVAANGLVGPANETPATAFRGDDDDGDGGGGGGDGIGSGGGGSSDDDCDGDGDDDAAAADAAADTAAAGTAAAKADADVAASAAAEPRLKEEGAGKSEDGNESAKGRSHPDTNIAPPHPYASSGPISDFRSGCSSGSTGDVASEPIAAGVAVLDGRGKARESGDGGRGGELCPPGEGKGGERGRDERREAVCRSGERGGTCTVSGLSWGSVTPSAMKLVTEQWRPQVVLGADVFYSSEHFDSVLATVYLLLSPPSVVTPSFNGGGSSSSGVGSGCGGSDSGGNGAVDVGDGGGGVGSGDSGGGGGSGSGSSGRKPVFLTAYHERSARRSLRPLLKKWGMRAEVLHGMPQQVLPAALWESGRYDSVALLEITLR